MKTTLRNVLWAAVAGSFLAAPAAIAQNFNTTPLSGKAKWDAWPGYFWSYFAGKPSGIAGGLAYRYKDNVSPAENFDKAFGNADKLKAAVGPVAAERDEVEDVLDGGRGAGDVVGILVAEPGKAEVVEGRGRCRQRRGGGRRGGRRLCRGGWPGRRLG